MDSLFLIYCSIKQKNSYLDLFDPIIMRRENHENELIEEKSSNI